MVCSAESSSGVVRGVSSFLSSSTTQPQNFSSSFSSFKQFSPATSSAVINVFAPQNPVNSHSPSLGNTPPQFSSHFNNSDINASKNSTENSSPFTSFRAANTSESQQSTYRNFNSSCKPSDSTSVFSNTATTKNPFSVASSNSTNNPFSVTLSNPPSNPFLGPNSNGSRIVSNPFMQSDTNSTRTSSFHCEVNRVASEPANPFLRSSCDASPTPGLPNMARSSSSGASVSAGSSPGSGTQHPHLFRPVSPAAVNATAAAKVADAPVPAAAAPAVRSISVDEMMTDDHTLPAQHLPLLRADCARPAAANDAESREADRHNRISLDSNKSFQDMDLTEDVAQTSLGMLH